MCFSWHPRAGQDSRAEQQYRCCTQDVWIVAPDKADERARIAMAALVTAMSRQDHLVSCPATAGPLRGIPPMCACWQLCLC